MTSGITEAMLYRIRQENLKFMPQRVIIRRWVPLGGGERERKIVATDVPAVFTAGAGTFAIEADRIQGINPYIVALPHDADVRPNDEIVDEEARTFHVRHKRQPESFIVRTRVLADLVSE